MFRPCCACSPLKGVVGAVDSAHLGKSHIFLMLQWMYFFLTSEYDRASLKRTFSTSSVKKYPVPPMLTCGEHSGRHLGRRPLCYRFRHQNQSHPIMYLCFFLTIRSVWVRIVFSCITLLQRSAILFRIALTLHIFLFLDIQLHDERPTKDSFRNYKQYFSIHLQVYHMLCLDLSDN